MGLQALCSEALSIHVLLFMDNATSSAYLRNYGGKMRELNDLTAEILYQPNNPTKVHPLKKLVLGAFRLSGKHYKAEEFRESLPSLSSKNGDYLLRNSMSTTSTSGSSFQVLDKLIHLTPL